MTPPVAPAAADTLRVLALGPLQVFVGDDAIDTTVWGSARPRELLVYLLMHPDGRTKEQVGLAFWPEASAAQLRNSFHVTLHRLRKALRNPDWITLSNDRYRVDPDVDRRVRRRGVRARDRRGATGAEASGGGRGRGARARGRAIPRRFPRRRAGGRLARSSIAIACSVCSSTR